MHIVYTCIYSEDKKIEEPTLCAVCGFQWTQEQIDTMCVIPASCAIDEGSSNS